MSVVLIGASGAGKTAIGRAIANSLGWAWLDTDREIEESYGKITEIFKLHGEAGFRKMEKKIVQEITAVSNKERLVLSTGGGTLMDEENAVALKNFGKILYLKGSPETLLARLKGCDDRPLLLGENGKKEFVERLEKRLPIYESYADFTVVTDGKTEKETLKEVVDILRANGVC